jgi:putative membrane protein insertion efficiency factor
MTKEFPMTNARTSTFAVISGPSFGLRHSLVIRISSLVIRVLTLTIRAYQLTISPTLTFLFGPTSGFRFTPTCSQYAMDAVREHGAVTGGALAAKRICRCHPWGGCGHDPVPGKAEGGRQKAETGIVLENAY